MELFGETLPTATALFLILALLMAFGFEFVNGFHDTANAVATVIYTHSLKPWIAVIWSGMWNLIGVLTSTGAVAFSVVALLPVELVLNVGSGAGFSMVFALLISAIVWNLGTWYVGLLCQGAGAIKRDPFYGTFWRDPAHRYRAFSDSRPVNGFRLRIR